MLVTENRISENEKLCEFYTYTYASGRGSMFMLELDDEARIF